MLYVQIKILNILNCVKIHTFYNPAPNLVVGLDGSGNSNSTIWNIMVLCIIRITIKIIIFQCCKKKKKQMVWTNEKMILNFQFHAISVFFFFQFCSLSKFCRCSKILRQFLFLKSLCYRNERQICKQPTLTQHDAWCSAENKGWLEAAEQSWSGLLGEWENFQRK